MGVSGCGKSAVGQAVADALALPLIEGDAFHPAANVDKMSRGVPLQDEDRAGWLARLGDELSRHPQGAVLTCSALKRSYRDLLRSHARGLRFLHLQVTQDEALRRVATRGGHFYPPSLVASQFEALENPAGEDGVLVVDAQRPVAQVTHETVAWINSTIRN
ncbi:gluconokinase [Caenimonas sp. DR4.4]|uniref:Gluconokinase n=2 Tax=Caenimonas aquaedulcis TaxID=2793270 RepID=A0A931H773_9BURK|nr:gluconokinase [Caenimonas aquaedulcis]MBG9389663.1 gluconokinase [Caenimonas aquaedulcis]